MEALDLSVLSAVNVDAKPTLSKEACPFFIGQPGGSCRRCTAEWKSHN